MSHFEAFDPQRLPLLLQCAKLAQQAYVDGETVKDRIQNLKEGLEQYMNPGGFKLLWAHFQELGEGGAWAPQWFLARGPDPRCRDGTSEALFLVFRGSQSLTDWIRDLDVGTVNVGKYSVHRGFYTGIASDSKDLLQNKAWHHFDKYAKLPCYVIGHSLGAALGMTIVATGLFWEYFPHHRGHVTAVLFGGPRVFAGPSPEKAEMYNAELIQVVNHNDPVPRLLGSSPLTLKAVLVALMGIVGWGAASHLDSFTHPEHMKLVYLKDNNVLHVPRNSQRDVLSLGFLTAALFSFNDHKMLDGYVKNISHVLGELNGASPSGSHVLRQLNGASPSGLSSTSSPGKTSTLCKFFAEGKCTKGGACSFSHTAPRAPLCKFFKPDKGTCKEGWACTWAHSNGAKSEWCTFFANGSCIKGLDCPFLHSAASAE